MIKGLDDKLTADMIQIVANTLIEFMENNKVVPPITFSFKFGEDGKGQLTIDYPHYEAQEN